MKPLLIKYTLATRKFCLANFDYGYDMTGCCGIASKILQLKLKADGFDDAKLVIGKFEGGDHCWVEIGNYICDPTVAQFLYMVDDIEKIPEKKLVRVVKKKYSPASYNVPVKKSKFKNWGTQSPNHHLNRQTIKKFTEIEI